MKCCYPMSNLQKNLRLRIDGMNDVEGFCKSSEVVKKTQEGERSRVNVERFCLRDA